MDSNEEPQDEEFLNKIDQGYVGIDPPRVIHSTDEGLTVPYWHPEAENGDNDPASPEQAWA